MEYIEEINKDKTDKNSLCTDFKEELHSTEENTKEILGYDEMSDEEIRKIEEEIEKAREKFLSQFKQYSE